MAVCDNAHYTGSRATMTMGRCLRTLKAQHEQEIVNSVIAVPCAFGRSVGTSGPNCGTRSHSPRVFTGPSASCLHTLADQVLTSVGHTGLETAFKGLYLPRVSFLRHSLVLRVISSTWGAWATDSSGSERPVRPHHGGGRPRSARAHRASRHQAFALCFL